MKKIWFFLLLIACSGPQSVEEKCHILPLSGLHTFALLPTIFAWGLDAHSVETELIAALEKIGTVSFSEGSDVSGTITLMLGKIGEEVSDAPAHYFPIFWLSMEVFTPAEVLKNHSVTSCLVWKKDVYFGEKETAEATSAKAISVLQEMIDEFALEYYKVNKEMIRPHFDIASGALHQKESHTAR